MAARTSPTSATCAKVRSIGPEIYKALAEIGYKGSATVELGRGDKAKLTEISRRFDLILTGAPLGS